MLAAISLAAPLLSPSIAMEKRIDPQTQRIRLIWGRAPTSSYVFALEDPRCEIRVSLPYLTYEKTMADLSYARRLSRIYMPRTYQMLLETIDLVVLEDIDTRIFTPDNVAWFRDGVRDHGLGLLMGGGSQGFGGNAPFTSWGDTLLDEIIPVQCYYDQRLPKDYLVRFRIVDEENALARSIPWRQAPPFYPPNFITPRPGCGLIIVSDDEKETPIYFYWDVGRGRFVGMQNLQGAFSMDFNLWTYYRDATINTLYFAAGYPLPEDLLTIHQLRESWGELRMQRDFLLSLIEFADKFGAQVSQVTARIGEAEAVKRASDELYMDGEYAGALDKMGQAIGEYLRLQELAIKIKDKALVWIYTVEWLSLTGTFMVAGFILWSLMVRRVLYREAGVSMLHRR